MNEGRQEVLGEDPTLERREVADGFPDQPVLVGPELGARSAAGTSGTGECRGGRSGSPRRDGDGDLDGLEVAQARAPAARRSGRPGRSASCRSPCRRCRPPGGPPGSVRLLEAKHIGFSVTTCFFARRASTMTAPWESALSTTTASIGSLSISRWSEWRRVDPVVVADVLRASPGKRHRARPARSARAAPSGAAGDHLADQPTPTSDLIRDMAPPRRWRVHRSAGGGGPGAGRRRPSRSTGRTTAASRTTRTVARAAPRPRCPCSAHERRHRREIVAGETRRIDLAHAVIGADEAVDGPVRSAGRTRRDAPAGASRARWPGARGRLLQGRVHLGEGGHAARMPTGIPRKRTPRPRSRRPRQAEAALLKARM